jgi:hypothetical protein
MNYELWILNCRFYFNLFKKLDIYPLTIKS